jgi:hypothetical protein
LLSSARVSGNEETREDTRSREPEDSFTLTEGLDGLGRRAYHRLHLLPRALV